MFANRRVAGRLLADRLSTLLSDRGWGNDRVTVVGLPRGGVPVASEVAARLAAPLDVIVVRKVGWSGSSELGLGAVGEDGESSIDRATAARLGETDEELEVEIVRQLAEVERRVEAVRSRVPALSLTGRVVVVVDDGLANGHTARVACGIARRRGAERVVLAVPVAPSGWDAEPFRDVDALLALETPEVFPGVGSFYRDFEPVDEAVMLETLLAFREP